ncbi:two-component system regulatory protein [Alcanivorax balearicus MACL04]|uniref:Two-component system regulatory protein n=1 Tax=Alloalcanivorax balearicus MACL04 TaxID=1177182 RepID=A0ABT2R3E8_9GAMM|nr:two-component system regulatory protein [Alloalcanivorax balearicus MACL04]
MIQLAGCNHLQVLIIEDNSALAGNLFDYLEARGHYPDAAPDGLSGLHLATHNHYDVIVLDWMLPRLSGLDFLKRLRDEAGLATPVLMLTAKDQLPDKIAGFEAGADDYLIKPFALAELEIRLRVLVSRGWDAGSADLCVGDLRFDPQTLEIKRGGRMLSLPPAGRRLLEVLMRASPKVVPREKLESTLWGDGPPDQDILRSHMYHLRKVVDRPFSRKLIHTAPRVGYRLCQLDHE